MNYLTEIKKLADGLMEKGIAFTFHALYEGYQIIVNDPRTQEYRWDAVCHDFSYGNDEGLSEELKDMGRKIGLDLLN